MNQSKFILKMVPGILLALVLVSSAGADTISYFQTGNVSSLGTANIAFDITPFDSTLGTLNSVTMSAEVNVSGSSQLWSPDEFATLSVIFANSLDAVPELGWGATVASFSDSTPLWYYDYDFGEGYAQLDGSGNSYAGPTTITSGFGRFAGPNPFSIGLQLSGLASSTGLGDTLVFSFDGNASLSYEYKYTPAPVPEPTTMMLLGLGLAGIAGARRKFRK
jgi:hypothetical protein